MNDKSSVVAVAVVVVVVVAADSEPLLNKSRTASGGRLKVNVDGSGEIWPD